MIVLPHGDVPRRSGPAVLLDRDGTLIEDVQGYVRHPADIRLLPAAATAADSFARLGASIAIVSNQAGIGRGVLSESAAVDLHTRVVALLVAVGLRVSYSILCPHREGEGCPCRKPAAGMVLAATGLLGAPVGRAFLVGDAARDVRAAWAAGAHPLLVQTGQGPQAREALRTERERPYDIVGDVAAAADLIGQRVRER
ncbi:D-glycero-alpha-D-manno-heptose-1,7-bisphosphate 7-phosphatase [Streptomyces sp. NPDC056161]|uniref:D-glycero-alpha-D-manno-heptose-1,7-bisphosphate 7-phosphatase n=1 Tax=Streptomyces sp. NPDC056161 TaxID=3345732 RepID=UPI0035D69E0B